MNRKLSDDTLFELSFLTMKELSEILEDLKDSFQGDRYDTLDHLGKYEDEIIKKYIPEETKLILQDNRSSEEKLEEIRGYYKKDDNNGIDRMIRKRGRKSKKDGTLKERVFAFLETNKTTATFEEVLKGGILNIAENTFKTILSQYRKEKEIKVKRGRK